MVIALRVDYGQLSTLTEAVENAEVTPEARVGAIVNVHANFVIPEDQRYLDGVFPHMATMHSMATEAEKRSPPISLADIPSSRMDARPFRRPDYASEWKLLKKAWSLHRNGKDKLSLRQISSASVIYYSDEPLSDLPDWLWRFAMMLGGRSYNDTFLNAFASVEPTLSSPGFQELKTYYEAEMSAVRAERFFEIMKAFFANFSEFGQVYIQIAAGHQPPSEGHRASSTDFDAIRMFYGNAFEAFSSQVDLLAYINNIQSGRTFSQFSKLTQAEYLALDKASRFNAFALNVPLIALCSEADNQIRNASHHGALQFDSDQQIISFRAGKGGQGAVQYMSYVDYLTKCTRLFLQLMVMLRMELLICQMTRSRAPI